MKQAAGDPRIVDLKFHDEQAIRLKQAPGPLHGFASVDVVVDADIGEVRRGRVRIEERKDDEIELVMAVLNVAAGVIEDNVRAGILIGVLEVQFTTKLENQGIDFNRDHSPGAVAKRGGDVVAHARAQD